MTGIHGKPNTGKQYYCSSRQAEKRGLVSMTRRKTETEICQDNGDGTGNWIIDPDLEEERKPGPLTGKSKKQKIDWINSQGLEENVANVFKAIIRS